MGAIVVGVSGAFGVLTVGLCGPVAALGLGVPRNIIAQNRARKTIFRPDLLGAHGWPPVSLPRAAPGRYAGLSPTDRKMPDSIAPDTNRTRLLIIGAGPAGYTAAIYAARAALEPVLVAGLQPGGQLMITTDVENYPGFAEVIQGPFLMEQMAAQAAHVGTRIIHDLVASVDFSARPFRCVLDSGQVWLADSVIVATGAQARWLGLESEQRLQGAGVSACATCDGFFYRGKRVAVIGGGNTAVEEALYLTHHASHVTLIHRRDSLRAERILQQRLFAHPKISVVWDSRVAEITAAGTPPTVDGVRLIDVKSGAESTLAVDGVFVAIGHSPTTALFAGQIEMDAEGYVVTVPGSTRTSVPGVFAAGDVQDKVFRQAVTAAGTGCMAALEAEKWLAGSTETASMAAY
jgi:thioredoxin reductase (NADPH)